MKKWHPNGQLQLEKEIELGIRLWSKEWDEVGELVTEYLLTEDQPEYSMLQLWRQKERQKQLAEND
jgi:antitoxin component YwqK of YwqJK toxin-antitoxin module